MKKIVSLMLALVMIMSLSAVAWADETGVGTGSYSADVTGTYVDGNAGSGSSYVVDITWTAMNFTYNGEKAPVWNAQTYSYSESVAAHWDDDKGTITVTNHSPHVISAKPGYTAGEGFGDAEMVFDTTELLLDTAENGREAKAGTITVTPSGSLPDTTGEGQVIGSVKVTIAGGALPVVSDIDSYLATCDAHRMNYQSQGLDVTAFGNAVSAASSTYTSGSATDMEKTAAIIAVENELNKLEAQAKA